MPRHEGNTKRITKGERRRARIRASQGKPRVRSAKDGVEKRSAR
jgi:hypothetical protein